LDGRPACRDTRRRTRALQPTCSRSERAALLGRLDDTNGSRVSSTSISRRVHAPRTIREGGSFRISLTYDEPTGTGKTTAHTDTYHGRFVKLVPNEQVVEVVEFETADPALSGEMTITTTLADADGGTHITAVHDGLPRGVSAVRQREKT
jgi:Activator of Hsp90 ATPase homolog 1-like protein